MLRSYLAALHSATQCGWGDGLKPRHGAGLPCRPSLRGCAFAGVRQMPRQLDFTEWDYLDPLKLAHAAHLWKGIAPVGNEVPNSSPAYSLFQRLKQEVHRRVGRATAYPKGYTFVSRDCLREIAKSWGERPAFLFPEDRVEMTAAQATIAAEKRCRSWLAGLMRGGEPTKPKSEYLLEAQALHGVGTKAFQRAWRDAVTDTGNATWSKPGRKS